MKTHGILSGNLSDREQHRRAAFRICAYIEMRYSSRVENEVLLRWYYALQGKVPGGLSIAAFARLAVASNKRTVPKAQQRGALGTNVKALDYHVRELLRKERRRRRQQH